MEIIDRTGPLKAVAVENYSEGKYHYDEEEEVVLKSWEVELEGHK